MSVFKSTHTQTADILKSSSAGSGHLLRRAVVASTSLIAMSAALGWNSPALAAGTCGAPSGSGVVNCNATAYPAGIQYAGPNAVDDLTVNVGSFAGQAGAVTVGGSGVLVEDLSPNPVSETVNVGSNVTISTTTYNDITDVGISYAGKAAATVYNAGSLTSTLRSGILAEAGAKYDGTGGASGKAKAIASVTNTGTISSYEAGVVAEASTFAKYATTVKAKASSSIANSGDVTTSDIHSAGLYSEAIAISEGYAHSYATAYAGASNSATIKTTGAYSSGIDVLTFSDAEVNNTVLDSYATSSSTSVAINTGKIKTSGVDAVGVLGEAIAANKYGTPLYGAATATVSLTNAGSIKTTGGPDAGGYGSDGIYGLAEAEAVGLAGGTSAATVNVTNAGSIKTTGDLAEGIGGYARGVGVSEYYATGGAYANVVNTGSIKTKGAGAYGIAIKTLGYAESYVANANAYSVVNVTNTGVIKTLGLGSDGIRVQANGEAKGSTASAYSAANVTNTGSITTKGDGAVGIYAVAGNVAYGRESAPYANTAVVNTGDIKTSGAGAVGIVAVSSSYAETRYVYSTTRSNVTNEGAITTSGAGSVGVYAYSTSKTASAGTIADAGGGKNYAASTVTNTGSVTTSGDYAIGVVALSKATSYSVYSSRAYAYSNVTNAGAIKTSGSHADGFDAVSGSTAIEATAYYPTAAKASTTVVNAGSVTATGAYSNGIVAASTAAAEGGASAEATATTMVTNAGTVSVKAAGAFGIQAYAGAYASSTGTATAKATTTVINAGSVSVTGAGATGVFAAALAGTNAGISPYGAATVVNAAGGTISSSGAGGIGVEAEAAQATVVTYAGSSIMGGTGAGAVGVTATGGAAIVQNAGTIGSGNDHAVALNGVYYAVLSNTGTVTGYVTLTTTGPASAAFPSAGATFLNYGTWIARGGNTTLSGGALPSNLVNEAGGTIVVVGNQTFTADTFTNLGLLTMTQASSAGLGARPAYETLTVSGDFTGIGGTLAVDATTQGGQQGDVLKITGQASGGTNVKATILGTPGQTTGNGILIVEAHKTTGASDFTLKGNASNGDEVAGAFEYNLDFVPGAGTSGDWYLQSQVYPGVYQFGQVGSSGILVADQANVSLDDLMSQAYGIIKNHSMASGDDTSQQVASMDNTFVPSPNGPGLSGWGRFDETRFNVNPNGSKYSDYNLRVDATQVGGDYDWHNAWNEVLIGGYVAPFHSFADFSSFGTHIRSSGTAYALYGLWFNGPWEGGLRLNYDPTSTHISDTFLGTNASFKTNEKGVQAAVRYDNMNLVDWVDFSPSAELNYGTLDGGNFADGAGDLVTVGRTNDFWGKLNGRFSTDVITERGLLVQPYLNIGVLYRGDTSTKVDIGTFSNTSNINGFNGDVAVGVNTNLASSLSLSAQVDYLAGNRVNGWTGFVGLRYSLGATESPPPAAAPMMPPPPPPPPAPTKTFIVFFDFNKSNLTAEAQSVVSEAVKAAKENGMVRVLVTGHTDTVGSDSYNMGLSVRRAQSVKEEMVREGMGGDSISIEGKGFHDPLVPTGPGVREPQNRRAVIDLGG
jgi:outer membrane autotransporter protein